MLVVIAQILTACQMVYEEKYVVSKNIPPLQAVGWEGKITINDSFYVQDFYEINTLLAIRARIESPALL